MDPLDLQPAFTTAEWAGAYAAAVARLSREQQDALCVSRVLPGATAFASLAHEGPMVWKREGGDPTLQALWTLALRELVGELPTVRCGVDTWHQARVVAAHLDFEGDVRFAVPIVVLGSVRAKGAIRDSGPESCVTIGGDVEAAALFTDGDMQLLGDVRLGILECQGSDNVLIALGDVRAAVIHEAGHACSWAKTPHASVHASLGDLESDQGRKLDEGLVPGLLDPDFPRLGRAGQAWARGAPVLRGT